MTLTSIYDLDLNITKTYLHTKSKLFTSVAVRHRLMGLKALQVVKIKHTDMKIQKELLKSVQ